MQEDCLWDDNCDFSDRFEQQYLNEMSCCDQPVMRLPRRQRAESIEWEWRDDFMAQEGGAPVSEEYDHSYYTAKWAENVEITNPNFDWSSQRSDLDSIPTFPSEN
jgi:hypothetical protein